MKKTISTIFLMRSILFIGFLHINLFRELNALNNLPPAFLFSLPSAISNAWNILSNIVPFNTKDQQATIGQQQQQQQQQCPLGQVYRCRCENILNLQRKRTVTESWQILQQANQSLTSGGEEVWAILNHGLIIYHRYGVQNPETPEQVLYALHLHQDNYLTIHFNITADELRLGQIPKDFMATMIVLPSTLFTNITSISARISHWSGNP